MRPQRLCLCGRSLAGTRADSRFCSSACRQRAYRERVTDKGVTGWVSEFLAAGGTEGDDAYTRRLRHFEPDPTEAAAISAMGALTEDEFERVLAGARAEGDLSQENVAAKCRAVTALSVTEER